MGIFDEAKGHLDANETQVEAGVDAAADFIDEKTGGQFSEAIDQAQTFAKEWVGTQSEAADAKTAEFAEKWDGDTPDTK